MVPKDRRNFFYPEVTVSPRVGKKVGSFNSKRQRLTTPQISKNAIGRVRKNKRAARAGGTYEQARFVLCKTVI